MEVVNKIEPPYTEEEKDTYLQAVWAGLISKENLSKEYHFKIGETLRRGVEKGFGGSVFNPFSELDEVYVKLQENIYVFSAAKQYQQVRQMSKVINNMGERAQFKDFKKVADVIFEDYNVNYLRTEFDTAVGQAQTARRWVDIIRDKDAFPLLQYNTQEDALVREQHARLNSIIKPVDDPFWDSFMPLNGWNCRCFTTQLKTGEVTDTSELNISEQEVPDIFKVNTGKKKIIFSPKHPYFKVGRNELHLKLNDFNLPIPRR